MVGLPVQSMLKRSNYYNKHYFETMDELIDKSPMPQNGKFKGVAMEDVPYWYLFWLEEQPYCPENVKDYINENRDVLLEEQKRANRNKKDY